MENFEFISPRGCFSRRGLTTRGRKVSMFSFLIVLVSVGFAKKKRKEKPRGKFRENTALKIVFRPDEAQTKSQIFGQV
jgi:hypothetical protein